MFHTMIFLGFVLFSSYSNTLWYKQISLPSKFLFRPIIPIFISLTLNGTCTHFATYAYNFQIVFQMLSWFSKYNFSNENGENKYWYFCVNGNCNTIEYTYYHKSSDSRLSVDDFEILTSIMR